MTNFENIKSMSVDDLAEFNVHRSYRYCIDYDYDERPLGYYEDCWETSDGETFDFRSDAVDHEFEWLVSDMNKIAQKVKTNGHGVYFCPNCNGSVWQNKDESKFCFRCGQELDWS